MTVKERTTHTKIAGAPFNCPQIRMSSLYAAATGGAGFLLHSLSLFAGSHSTNVNVNASVASNCKFTGINSLHFGDYDFHLTSPTDVSGQANLTCTKGTSVTLSINNGVNASGPQRRMTDGSGNLLNYQIYTNAARTTIWDTTNTVSFVSGTSGVTTIPVYGRIPAGQSGGSGTGGYSDTITITATF